MAKFKKGDRVRCVKPDSWGNREFVIGDIMLVKKETCDDMVFVARDGSKLWCDHWELAAPEPIPETVTVNGVEYIRKPSAPHSRVWEFGDVASHKEHGVGIVTSWASSQYAIEITTRSSNQIWVNPFELTFIRRADLSV